MISRARALVLALPLLAAFAGPATAQDLTGPTGGYLRSDWAVEAAPGGRARVVGYLYNSNIKDAANVWVRVDRLGSDGTVAGSYRRRVVGDVLSGGRSLFDVPVGEPTATYRVSVETLDWVKECR
jgi:hypothetical protein